MSWYSYKKKYPKFGGAIPFWDGYGMLMFIVVMVLLVMAALGRVLMWVHGVQV